MTMKNKIMLLLIAVVDLTIGRVSATQFVHSTNALSYIALDNIEDMAQTEHHVLWV